jgi:Secretion system C-terminal sorting domain
MRAIFLSLLLELRFQPHIIIRKVMKKNIRFRCAAIASIFAPAIASCRDVHRVAICGVMLVLGCLSGVAQPGQSPRTLLPSDFAVSIHIDTVAGDITYQVRATLLAGHDIAGMRGWWMPLQLKLPLPGITLSHHGWHTSFDSLTANVSRGNLAPYIYDADVHCWSRSALKGGAQPWVEWHFVMEGVHETGMPVAMIAGLIQVDVIDGLRLVQADVAVTATSPIFEAFPNPCTGVLHIRNISGSRGAAVLQVLDSKGNVLHTLAFAGDVQSIDMGALPSGMYLLRVLADGQLPYCRRFVKQ